MAGKKKSRLTEALLETAAGMRRIGMIDDETYRRMVERLLRHH